MINTITGLWRFNTIRRLWYWTISYLDSDSEVTLMNFGYADDNPLELAIHDEKNRYPIQMYNYVATSLSKKLLNNKDVLEVGCGRGGGASYIFRYLNPKSVTGIDLCKKAIDFCKMKYPDLSFYHGDAMNLPFEDNSFDIVINVESSHHYDNMEKFLRKVYRTLRPKGYFLFADFRNGKPAQEHLEEQMKNSGMGIVRREIITPNVVKSLELDNERKLKLIRKLSPKFLHKLAEQFAGIRGSDAYNSLLSGEKEYYYFVLRKESGEGIGDVSEFLQNQTPNNNKVLYGAGKKSNPSMDSGQAPSISSGQGN